MQGQSVCAFVCVCVCICVCVSDGKVPSTVRIKRYLLHSTKKIFHYIREALIHYVHYFDEYG